MDKLDELALLVAIVEGGSLAAGARKTGRSPAAVTRALRDLERRLGIHLIERNTRRIAATQAGKDLVGHARCLLDQYSQAIDGTVSGIETPTGTLRISAPLEFGRRHVAPIVLRFLDLYPRLNIEMVLADEMLNLVEQEVDVAIRIGNLPDNRLVAKPVGNVRRIAVASPTYLERNGVPRSLKDLEKHEYILQTRAGGLIEWPLSSDARKVIRSRARLLVNGAEPAIAAARAGRGIAMPLSYQVAPDLAARNLVRVLEKFSPPPIPINLVVTRSRRMANKVRTFIDYASTEIRALDQSQWI